MSSEVLKWYKIQVHTFGPGEAGGQGGTNADVSFHFWGSERDLGDPEFPQAEESNEPDDRATWWLNLTNNKTDQHEANTVDLYYYQIPERFMGQPPMRKWKIALIDPRELDKNKWSYELWVFVLNEASMSWKRYGYIPPRTSLPRKGIPAASDQPFSGGTAPCFKAAGTCHIDSSGRPSELFGSVPNGINYAEVTAW